MCLFCNIPKTQYIYEDDYVYAIHDSYAVSKGHTLIIPKKHRAHYFDATENEVHAIHKALHHLKLELDTKYHPDGYNIGINNGLSAGQTILHLHVHLIPRYEGDMTDPRGGVRGVIPEKQKY